MYEVMELSRSACAFMIRSMLAAHDNFFNLVSKYFFHEFRQRFELSLKFLQLFLLVLIFNIQTFLGGRLELLSIKLLELLDSILINRIYHVQDLKTLLAKIFQER